MNAKKPLLIVGAGLMAEVALDCFRAPASRFDPVAFAVDAAYRDRDRLLDLPVEELETLATRRPPNDHAFFAAVGYSRRNAVRAALVERARAAGYEAASWVSPRAAIAPTSSVGGHSFILDFAVAEPRCEIGFDVVLWTGATVCHHARVGDHCFLGPRSVVASKTTIGACSFIGAGAILRDGLTIGERAFIGAGAVVTRDVAPGETIAAAESRTLRRD
jgi:sugar O-acyltransferase (sialic acid O-acetyltransferase NeuD family)